MFCLILAFGSYAAASESLQEGSGLLRVFYYAVSICLAFVGAVLLFNCGKLERLGNQKKNWERWKHACSLQRAQLESERQRGKEYWWSLNGLQFERELAKLYRKLGYKASVTRASNDGGVDIVLVALGEKTLVQCKAHKRPIGVKPVRELYGVLMADTDASEAVMFALAGWTSSAEAFARGKPIYLCDMTDLIAMAEKAEEG